MKKIISNYRYYVLFALCLICSTGLLAVPNDELPPLTWLWVLFSTKAAGLGAGFLVVKLCNRWEAKNMIPELTNFVNDF